MRPDIVKTADLAGTVGALTVLAIGLAGVVLVWAAMLTAQGAVRP